MECETRERRSRATDSALSRTMPSSDLLSAPEIGPVADAISLYDAVARSRTIPIGKRSVIAIAIPAALPLLAVFAIEVPVKELLLKLLTTLA